MNKKTLLTDSKSVDSLFSKLIDEHIIFIDATINSASEKYNPIIASVTNSTSSMLGYNESELIGLPLAALCHEKKEVKDLVSLAARCGKRCEVEKILLIKKGEERVVLISCRAQWESGRKLRGIHLVGQDITGRKNAEDQLLKQKNCSFQYLRTWLKVSH